MSDVKITLRENGPILVEGKVALEDSAGNVVDLGEKEKFFLCRCGHSKNGPFCDGTHKTVDFTTDDTPKS